MHPPNSPTSFNGQTLLVLGLGREGVTAARWLVQHGAHVIASDVRPASDLQAAMQQLDLTGIDLRLGSQTPDLLAGVDAIVVSPGVHQALPLLQRARENRIPVTSETRLFRQHCPAQISGITGSSGKTTTTTLTQLMLKESGFTTWLGGNIGTPLLAQLSQINSQDRVVMELSSFQLLTWKEQPPTAANAMPWHRSDGLSPDLAALLNLTPNHLDRHPSMNHYIWAKSTILAYQRAGDTAVLNLDDQRLRAWAERSAIILESEIESTPTVAPIPAGIAGFSLVAEVPQTGAWLAGDQMRLRWQDKDSAIISVADVPLRGRHNQANLLAAFCLAAAAGATTEAMAMVAATFKGVEHRLEVVRSDEDVIWINDSIATSPERAIAALLSFNQPIILLAGGRDKHLPWQDWADVVHHRVVHLITFGESARLIEQALEPVPQQTSLLSLRNARDLAEAVHLAAELAQPGMVILLSPGCVSFDAYPDFSVRGQHFRELVSALSIPTR